MVNLVCKHGEPDMQTWKTVLLSANLLGLQCQVDEDLLQLLVDVIDEKLLKAVVLKNLPSGSIYKFV